MSSEEIKPTYIGNNENLVFIVPKELFTMKVTPKKKIDANIAKEFSKYIRGAFKGLQLAMKTRLGNENNIKTETSPEFWENFEKKARDMDIDFIGYTPVVESYIFKNLKIYGKNVIVLGMEMKWDKIKIAPSVFTAIEVFRVYVELGDKTIELTNYLKEQGYKSEAHHPFGGKLLFPAHAVTANLGIKGGNGLTLTPEFGLRQRWSIISTDAEIPKTPKRDFSELEEFCKNCRACIKNCLGGAAFEKPIENRDGKYKIYTHIDRPKCIESLLNNNYCSICLKVCPLGHPKK